MTGRGWAGSGGPYTSVYTLTDDRGGGLENSRAGRRGRRADIRPSGYATGGGLRQSTAAPLAGFGGVGGPGPGALIGVNGQ